MAIKSTNTHINKDKIKQNIIDFFDYIGEDPNREGLKETPNRVIRAIDELFSGYKLNPKDVLNTTFIDGKCDEMIILDNIEFISFCEHHILPIVGVCHIGYIPSDKIVGISKLARIVDVFAKRLQVQERMTARIADAIIEILKPKGVIVVCESKHYCMIARGIKKQNSVMKTSAIRGVFEKIEVRQEFLNLIQR